MLLMPARKFYGHRYFGGKEQPHVWEIRDKCNSTTVAQTQPRKFVQPQFPPRDSTRLPRRIRIVGQEMIIELNVSLPVILILLLLSISHSIDMCRSARLSREQPLTAPN